MIIDKGRNMTVIEVWGHMQFSYIFVIECDVYLSGLPCYSLFEKQKGNTLKWLGNIASDSEQNPWFSSSCNHNYKPVGQSHDFYKPIACLIIKIFMSGNRNFIFRFLYTIVYWRNWIWYNRSHNRFWTLYWSTSGSFWSAIVVRA